LSTTENTIPELFISIVGSEDRAVVTLTSVEVEGSRKLDISLTEMGYKYPVLSYDGWILGNIYNLTQKVGA
jgi:hypothetical protein